MFVGKRFSSDDNIQGDDSTTEELVPSEQILSDDLSLEIQNMDDNWSNRRPQNRRIGNEMTNKKTNELLQTVLQFVHR